MTAPRDPQQLIAAFLDEGPAELSPRLAQAIRGDVHHTRQRAWRRRSWVAPSLPRSLALFLPLAAVALLAAALMLAAGAALTDDPTTVAPSPAVDPAGTTVLPGEAWIVYESTDGVVMLVRPDGSGSHRLTGDTARQATPDWSPDGSRIAWAQASGGGTELWVATATGDGARRITEDMTDCGRSFSCSEVRFPRWSPDGRSVVFIRSVYDTSRWVSDTITLVDVESGEIREVHASTTDHLAWPDLSPEGSRVVVEVATYENPSVDQVPVATGLAILDLGGAAGPGTIPGMPAFAGRPQWGAGHDDILFRVNGWFGGVRAPVPGTQIGIVSPDGSRRTTILEHDPAQGLIRGPSRTAAGDTVLFSQTMVSASVGGTYEELVERPELRAVDADGTDERSATGDVRTFGSEPRLRPLR